MHFPTHINPVSSLTSSNNASAAPAGEPSDAQLQDMPAPGHVSTLKWSHSNPQERRALLKDKNGLNQEGADASESSTASVRSTGNPVHRLDQFAQQQAPFSRRYQSSPQEASSSATENAGAASNEEQGALEQITQQFQQRFADSAQHKDEFHALMKKTFGEQYDVSKAETIRQQTLKGDFSWMPKIQLVDGGQLNDISGMQAGGVGKGAYSADKDTVYLSRDLLNSDPAEAEKVLTEEVGHALDARINTQDAKGDEGDIFSRQVHGEEISSAELTALQQENDSGMIEVDGEKVEVEFGFLSDVGLGAVEDFGDSIQDNVIDPVKDAVEDAGDSFQDNVIDPAKDAVEDAGEWFEDNITKPLKEKVLEPIMESEWLGYVMTVLQFVPIANIVATAYNVVKAGYMAYQGIKHKSWGMALTGIAGLAGGAGNLAGAAGFANFAGKAATFSNYAGQAGAAYTAISEKDFSAAAGLAGNVFGNDSKITQGFEVAGKANEIHEAVQSKDYLGAVGMGSTLLQDFTGPEGDKLLQGIGDHANIARSVEFAVNTGDYGKAAQVLTEQYGDNLGLSSSQQENINNTIGTFKQVQTAKDLIEGGDYAQGSQVLIGAAKNHTSNPETRAQLDKTGKVIQQVDQTITAAKEGRYAEAVMLGNNTLGNPLDEKTMGVVADVQEYSDRSRRISKAIEAKDFATAKAEISGLAEFVGGKPDVMKLIDDKAVNVEDFIYRQVAGRATSAYGEVEKLLSTEDVNVDFSDKNFKQWTGGLSIEQSQQMYEARTGKSVSREAIETLFTDPEKSREVLMNDPNLHIFFREILNTNKPTNIETVIDSPEWKELSMGQSVLHGSATRGHRKFISADGYREIVFDSQGNLVKNDVFKGTFNFFSPTEYSNAHIQADVDPYVEYGN